MKFLEAYKIISEDKIDDLLKKYTVEHYYHDVLRKLYTELPITVKSHNKFGKFLEWIVKNIEEVDENFETNDIITIWNGYIKYNLKIQDFETVQEMWDDIHNRKEKRDLENINPKLAKKIYEDEEKIVIIPLNPEGSVKYGVDGWCISNERDSNDAADFWYEYIGDGKLSHFVIYKTKERRIVPDIKDEDGDVLDVRKANVQVDLEGQFYITNINNTVVRGKIDSEADKILQFMKLDKNIFKSLKDEKTLQMMIDNDSELLNAISDQSDLWYLINKKERPIIEVWFKALENGKVAKVKQLMSDPDFNINNTGSYYPALHLCITNNQFDIMKLLLTDKRIDINGFDTWGYTPLMRSIFYNEQKYAEELLKHPDIDVNKFGIIDASLMNPLLIAASMSYFPKVKLLLSDPRIDITLKNDIGYTAEHYVKENGNTAIQHLFDLYKIAHYKKKHNLI